jgi:hypothetical protein
VLEEGVRIDWSALTATGRPLGMGKCNLPNASANWRDAARRFIITLCTFTRNLSYTKSSTLRCNSTVNTCPA